MFRLRKDNKIKVPGFNCYIDINLYNYNREWQAKAEETFLKGCRNILKFK